MRGTPKLLRKLVGLSMVMLALPALAQTVDGGQGSACSVDSDCGNICGWICDWSRSPHLCLPAIFEAA